MPQPTRRAALVGVPVALLSLAACSTGPTTPADAGAPAASGSDAADAFPVTVEHAFGTTTIEQAPARVVTIGWSDHDSVAALGVVPTAAPKITWGGNDGGSTDYFDAQLAKLGAAPSDVTRYDDADGIPVDEIVAMQPDLIIGANSGMTERDYAKLSKIAPTVGQPEGVGPWATPWDEQTRLVGQALGRTDQADQVVRDTEKAIDEAVAQHPEIAGKTVAWLWFTPGDLSTVGIYTSEDLRPQMLRRFGLKDAPIVTKTSKTGGGSYSTSVSAEKAATIDSDIAIFYIESDAELAKITGDPLLRQIPAIKSKHYVSSADNAAANPMSSPSPLSIPYALEHFLPKIARAAQGEPVK